jgi:ectoine hydroxylase-related dioxygenase (phytanoyl-CoA dioxygenase family)
MGRSHNRHLDCPELMALASHPALLARAAAILGPDLLVWRVHIFDKPPGGKEIPWHQDWNYWPLEPAVIVSAWIAVDEATVENSCVQLIPGSHKRMQPHVRSGPEMAFSEMADTTGVDLSTKVDMELRPGQCFLFNERMLHHSEPNRSTKRRMGAAVRLIPPLVRVLTYDGDDHGVVLVHGEDRLGFNRRAKRP